MLKTCTICKEDKEAKEFYRGRHQCIPCYLARNKVSTADLEHIQDKLEHKVGKLSRNKARQGRRIAKLKTRVGNLEDKVNDICNTFEQMRMENSQLKTQLDLAVSESVRLDEDIKSIKEEGDKRLRRVARMFAITDREINEKSIFSAEDFYEDLVGGDRIVLYGDNNTRVFDPEKLVWKDV